MAGNGVDQGGDDEAQEKVGDELGAFGDGAGNDSDGGGGEDALEEPVGVGPQAIRVGGGGFGEAEVGEADEAADVGAEHEGVAEQEERDGAAGEVEHVLHEDVAGVFGAGESGFDHGEAGLHEHDEHAGEQGPNGVSVHDRQKFGSFFSGFLGQSQAGQSQDGQWQGGQGHGRASFVKIPSCFHNPPRCLKFFHNGGFCHQGLNAGTEFALLESVAVKPSKCRASK